MLICCSFQQLDISFANLLSSSTFYVFLAWIWVFSSSHRFSILIQVRALCRPVSKSHFVRLEVVLHQERCVFWGRCGVGRQREDLSFGAHCYRFVCRFSKNLHISFLMIPSTLMRFSVPDKLNDHNHHTTTIVFQCGEGVLWVVRLFLLYPRASQHIFNY